MGKRGPKPQRKEVLWSPEVAYAVGLIASDGCLSNDGRHLTIVSKDIEQLENIQKCLKLNVNIANHIGSGDGDYFRLQWSDVTLYDFLLGVGLTPRKSLTIGALKIPDEFFFHFLRGSYDGDGSFYSYFDKRWKSSFMFYMTFLSASEHHILWIQETIERLANLRGHIVVSGRDTTMYSLRYAKDETRILLMFMYPTVSAISLTRKRLKIIDALGIVGESILQN